MPTGLGIAFALMLFAMFLGAMNYANNLALGLDVHAGRARPDRDALLPSQPRGHPHCDPLRPSPCSQAERARFRIALENPAPLARHEITIANDHGSAEPVRIDPAGRAVLTVASACDAARLSRRSIISRSSTRHPFGLFRAWAHLHMDVDASSIRDRRRAAAAAAVETDTGGAQDTTARR